MFLAGIYNNVRIKRVIKNDQGTLVIHLEKGKADDDSFLDALSDPTQSGNDLQSGSLMEFPPKVTGFGGDLLDYKQISQKLTTLKNKIVHILGVYMPVEEIVLDPLRGSNINNNLSAEEIEARFTNQTTVDVIYNNYVDDFVELWEKNGDPNMEVRLKLARSSTKKNYGKLPDTIFGYDNKNAFIEPMTISDEQSKIGWSDYEAKRGKHANRNGFAHNDDSLYTEEDSIDVGDSPEIDEVFTDM